MDKQVVFYQLRDKFVNNQESIPENAHQVIYYSLAIGHHVGVLDCLECSIRIPFDEYKDWIALLPEGNGRHKLEGVLKWGEIEINRSHVGDLLLALKTALPHMSPLQAQWAGMLSQIFQCMVDEPALYMMVRRIG
jgi:hydrogenase-4 component J